MSDYKDLLERVLTPGSASMWRHRDDIAEARKSPAERLTEDEREVLAEAAEILDKVSAKLARDLRRLT